MFPVGALATAKQSFAYDDLQTFEPLKSSEFFAEKVTFKVRKVLF